MYGSIFIILGIILFTAVLFKYARAHDKKKTLKREVEDNMEIILITIPWWKGVIYFLSLGLLFIGILAYFVLKDEIGINLGIIEWVIIIALFMFLHSKSKKIKIRKKIGSFSFYLVEEGKKEDSSNAVK